MRQYVNLCGAIVMITLTAALILLAMGGNPGLIEALGLIAAISTVILLIQAYLVGIDLDHADPKKPGLWIRAHILLHIVPLSYFLWIYLIGDSTTLKLAYVLPIVIFFITGTMTWTITFRLLNIKLFKLFELGNVQMIAFFPIALVMEILAWPTADTEMFTNLANGYFAAHFMAAGIAIPLMNNGAIKLTQKVD